MSETREELEEIADRRFHEIEARCAAMSWAVDKLRRLKKNCEYLAASCEEIAQALSEDNPRLQIKPRPLPPKERKTWE